MANLVIRLNGQEYTQSSVGTDCFYDISTDFSVLTATQITELTRQVDFAQLSVAQQASLCQAIVDAGCSTANLDFSALTATQITELSQIFDFTQLTAAQQADLTTLIETLPITIATVNAGTTAAAGDGANGSVALTIGDILHFWSSDATVNVGVTAGSAVVDLTIGNIIIPAEAVAPVVGVEGSVYYNTAEDILYVSDGTNWIPVDKYGVPSVSTVAGTDFFGNAYAIGDNIVTYPDGVVSVSSVGGGISADVGQVLTLGTDSLPLLVKDCGTPAVVAGLPEPVQVTSASEIGPLDWSNNIVATSTTGQTAAVGAVVGGHQLYDLVDNVTTNIHSWSYQFTGFTTTPGDLLGFKFVYRRQAAGGAYLGVYTAPDMGTQNDGLINVRLSDGLAVTNFPAFISKLVSTDIGNGLQEVYFEYTASASGPTNISIRPFFNTDGTNTPNNNLTGTLELGGSIFYNNVTASTNGTTTASPAVPGPLSMVGADATTDGECGFVPTPLAGDENSFLKGDGTWSTSTGDSIYTGGGNVPAATTASDAGNLTFDSGTDATGVVFNGTGAKVATFNGNINVTGLIDPIGMQFSGIQSDTTIPNGTIYITDGSLSGVASGEFVFKDLAGNYHALENVDLTALSAADITAITQAIDFTQLLPAQVTNLTQVIDYSQLTAAQITALETALGLPATIVESVTGTAVDNTDPLNPVIDSQVIVSTDADNAILAGSDLGAYLDSNGLVADLDLTANILQLKDAGGNNVGTSVDISPYLDDTNLARIVSGTLNGTTGIATITRDDASTFTIDFSAFLSDLVFTGATAIAAGTQGDVPAPAAGDEDKYLAGDGTWKTLAAGHLDDDVETVTGTAVDNTDPRNPIINLVDEVIENAGALSGAAPAGSQWGVDTTTGQPYYVSAGNWTPVPAPTATVDASGFVKNLETTDNTLQEIADRFDAFPTLKVYTTAERDALTPVGGETIFNSDTQSIEYWSGVDTDPPTVITSPNTLGSSSNITIGTTEVYQSFLNSLVAYDYFGCLSEMTAYLEVLTAPVTLRVKIYTGGLDGAGTEIFSKDQVIPVGAYSVVNIPFLEEVIIPESVNWSIGFENVGGGTGLLRIREHIGFISGASSSTSGNADYQVSLDFACSSEIPDVSWVTVNPYDTNTQLSISTDLGNEVTLGTDGGIYHSSTTANYENAFAAGVWAGAAPNFTYTITAGTHGLGTGMKHVTVIDAANDVVTTDVNINPTTGNVVLTSATAFAGTILIS